MKPKKRIFTFGAILFSLLLTTGNIVQSQESPSSAPLPQQPSTADASQSNWIGWAGGAIVALIGIGFGLVQLRKSQQLERQKLELQQSLEQEKLESQQRLEQEKLESQQRLEQEKLEWQQKLEQERLELQQRLEQEKLEWQHQKLILEDETLQLKSDLKLEQQRQEKELQKQLDEAEEVAKHEAESETIEEEILDEETEVYREKVLTDLRNEQIVELKRKSLNHADYS